MNVEIIVNGQKQSIADGLTVRDFLGELGFDPRQVAVEVNLQLVPRARHGEHLLSAGDRLEVVTLVGGG